MSSNERSTISPASDASSQQWTMPEVSWEEIEAGIARGRKTRAEAFSQAARAVGWAIAATVRSAIELSTAAARSAFNVLAPLTARRVH